MALGTGWSVFHQGGGGDLIEGDDITSVASKAVFPSSSGVGDIVSTDIADNPTGVGAQEVRVSYLTDDFALVQENIELNGTSVVQLSQPFLRAVSFRVRRTGSQGSPVGSITLRHGLVPVMTIPFGALASREAQATVPIGWPDSYIISATLAIEEDRSNVFAGVGVLIRNEGDEWRSIGSLFVNAYSTVDRKDFPLGYPLTPKTDIRMNLGVLDLQGGPAAKIGGSFDIGYRFSG